MFSTTFLGHQGWIFQTERACLLVDPLLREQFGHAHALEYRVFPPRDLKLEAFPRVDALMLTHEHDDHFDIPSLATVDRRIPVFLSARSSMAAYNILCEMGFQVYPLLPGMMSQVGDLEIVPLCGDHVNTDTVDEWDTLPFLVRQADGHGSFFSTVDVALTPTLVQLVRGSGPRPGLVGWTNNALDWSHMAINDGERGDSTAQATQRMRAGHSLISEGWGPPSAMLFCAGGFSFEGERAWLNKRVFCVDTERVCKAMSATYPGQRFFSTRPGQTFVMEGNALKRVDKQTDFLGTTAPETWPSRAKAPVVPLPDYAPATGVRDLPEADFERLRQRIQELAESLVGSLLFRSLYSLLSVETEGRMPTFALVLRSGAQRLVLEYNPNACTFDQGNPEHPDKVYLAGMECWATDLLAILSGELGAIALNFGRAVLWNALPQRFNFDIFGALHRMSHPLRRPAEYLRTYQRLLKECGAVEPRILPRAGT